MLEEYRVNFVSDPKIKHKDLSAIAYLVKHLFTNCLGDRNSVPLDQLRSRFTGELLKILLDNVPSVVGTITIGDRLHAITHRPTGTEILPYLTRYADNKIVEQFIIVNIQRPPDAAVYISFHILPSPNNPTKEAIIFNREGFGIVVVSDGKPAYYCFRDNGEIRVEYAQGGVGESLLAVLRMDIESRVSSYVAQQPTLTHSSKRKQVQEYLKDNRQLHDQLTFGKLKVVTNSSVYVGEHITGSTKKPHERDTHKRIYRNADGSIKKVIQVPASKIHGGSAASGNIRIVE